MTRTVLLALDTSTEFCSVALLIADPAAAPVVVHCMAGKDRTGVVCALTLALLGVSDHDIAEDYALTEVSMASLTEYLLKTKPHVVQDKYHMFNCPKDAMLLFLDDLRVRYGSVPAYVREIGVSDQQVAATYAQTVANELRRLLALPMTDPALEVDADLRPEGKQGPLVRTLDSYAAYYAKWSKVWEFQALLRADAVVGDEGVRRRFTELIDPLRFPASGITEADVAEVRRVKARVDLIATT